MQFSLLVYQFCRLMYKTETGLLTRLSLLFMNFQLRNYSSTGHNPSARKHLECPFFVEFLLHYCKD